MQTMTLKRVDVMSAAKIGGILYGLMGLIFGAIISSVFVLGGLAGAPMGNQPAWMGLLFGAGSVILLPIFYGAMGFVSAIIASALYNMIAGMIGGVRWDVEITPGAVFPPPLA